MPETMPRRVLRVILLSTRCSRRLLFRHCIRRWQWERQVPDRFTVASTWVRMSGHRDESFVLVMKLAFSTLGCPHWELEQVAQAARASGYQAVELRAIGGALGLLRRAELP